MYESIDDFNTTVVQMFNDHPALSSRSGNEMAPDQAGYDLNFALRDEWRQLGVRERAALLVDLTSSSEAIEATEVRRNLKAGMSAGQAMEAVVVELLRQLLVASLDPAVLEAIRIEEQHRRQLAEIRNQELSNLEGL
jgi:hypothetical protein